MSTPTLYGPPRNPAQRHNSKGYAQAYNAFRPPQLSPADDSGRATPKENRAPLSRSSTGSTSRKRPRNAGPEPSYETPYSTGSASWTSLNGDLSRSIGTASPPPLINTKYRLAGGLDTPTREAAAQFDNLDCGSESEFRRRWTSSEVDGSTGQRTILVGALDRERNGRPRGQVTGNTSQETWGQFVYNVVGDVAGKMWEFCRGTAFRGFTAGGGTAYEMTPSAPKEVEHTPSRRESWWERATPVPGQYPEDDFEEVHASDLETRPSKRLQTSQGRDWVVVNPSPSSSTRRRTFSSQMSYAASPSYRNASSKALHPKPSAARRSRTSTARLSSVSDVGSPHLESNHGRSASFASPRSRDHSPQIQRSPASAAAAADVQKYTAKRNREERQADASMKKLNQQLKMMIRQGKEALASKVEVQDDGFGSEDLMDEDEGYAEDDYGMEEKPW